MVKRLLSILMLLLCVFGASAQQPQVNTLPLDPKVRHGVLPNGMNYYLLHNEEPKGRANFYIAQKVGSTLETPQQLGLAHFLEHMAFNGSKNYPGSAMLEYLQSKGIRFGADINAYTSFDETVYNIDNIPTNDQALMDSVLLVLHDWSCDLLLEDKEIDAERGVIQEEWRSRNDAGTRMYTSILPQIYQEYQYTRMPIGTMEVVMNFPYNDLRDYYHKWYRPDQQGIVVVGDFDVDAMEAKVKETFTPIVMPENAAPREYPEVSDNEEPIYATFTDPELPVTQVTLSFKTDTFPKELRNSVEYFTQDIVQDLISDMMNNRFSEMAEKKDCPFTSASLDFDNYYVSTTKDATDLSLRAKGDVKEAFKAAVTEFARAMKTGFTDSELQRAKDELLSRYEKAYNERENTKTGKLARQLYRTFIDNTPYPGIETEWQLVQQMLQFISTDLINYACSEVITPNNQVIVVAQTQKEGNVLPAKEEMLGVLNEALNQEYEAYVDEVITEPLIAKLPKAGKIVKTEEISDLGATKYTLSNGAVVYVKKTDFKADEVLIAANNLTGKCIYEGAEADNLALIDNAVDCSKLGTFDNTKLRKYLSGKNVSMNYNLAVNTSNFKGSSSVKDLKTACELLYSFFTQVNPDVETYEADIEKFRSILPNYEKNAQVAFQKHFLGGWYNNNPYVSVIPTMEQIDKADYNKMLSIYKDYVKNAADYAFYFVGNVDDATIKPLIEQYIATLPGNAKKKSTKTTNYNLYTPKGGYTDDFKFEMESPQVMVFNALTGNDIELTLENEYMLDFAADILDVVFTRTLREEEGGTYSPQCGSDLNYYTKDWTLYSIYLTGDESKDKLAKRAAEETYKLLSEGATEDDFNKVKGAALNQQDINSKTNSYWLSGLKEYNNHGQHFAAERAATIEGITLDKLNAFMKRLANSKNNIDVILNGVAKN